MSKKQFSFGMAEAPKDFGNPPNLDTSDVYQYYPDTCAIRSQELILKDFGINISQEELIQQAIDNGWYEPGQGTSPLDVGKLLELNGIPVNQYENGNIFSLVNELAQGHKVIVGVDSNELWNNGPDWMDMLGVNTPNHALLVSNIDTTDPNNITVTLTDPGTGDVAKVYSWEQFEDAWRDSNCFVVATQDPAPPTVDYMCNFDYETGHLDTVFHGLPFDDFQTHFGCMFNMDIHSADFKDTLLNTLNSPTLKDWVSTGAGVLADTLFPGTGGPVTVVVRQTLDHMVNNPSSQQVALGAIDSDPIVQDLTGTDTSGADYMGVNTSDVSSYDDSSQMAELFQDVPDIPPMDDGSFF